MPYADPEKQREAQRKSVAKRRAEKKAAGVREGNPDVRARVERDKPRARLARYRGAHAGNAVHASGTGTCK